MAALRKFVEATRAPLKLPVDKPEGIAAIQHIMRDFKVFFGEFRKAAQADDNGGWRLFPLWKDRTIMNFMAVVGIHKGMGTPARGGQKTFGQCSRHLLIPYL